MRIEFAPMEGVTDAVYRRTHQRFFGGVARYWMPFWAPTQDHRLTTRVRREILPEANESVPVLPQLLTKSAEDFLWAAGELAAMGYGEVNLNLGCPSGTVTAKGKGAGFLGDLPRLEQFLDAIFAASPLPISIKTRLGVRDPEEFAAILALYNRYPLKSLAVHARVLEDQYRRPARPEWFAAAIEGSRCPVYCNGDLRTAEDLEAASQRYPAAAGLLAGRGLLEDPAMARTLQGGSPADRQAVAAFGQALFEAYEQAFGGAKNAMPRMKEHWRYLLSRRQSADRAIRRLGKLTEPDEFAATAHHLALELPGAVSDGGR